MKNQVCMSDCLPFWHQKHWILSICLAQDEDSSKEICKHQQFAGGVRGQMAADFTFKQQH